MNDFVSNAIGTSRSINSAFNTTNSQKSGRIGFTSGRITTSRSTDSNTTMKRNTNNNNNNSNQNLMESMKKPMLTYEFKDSKKLLPNLIEVEMQRLVICHYLKLKIDEILNGTFVTEMGVAGGNDTLSTARGSLMSTSRGASVSTANKASLNGSTTANGK